MKHKTTIILAINIIGLVCALGNFADAEVVYNDKNGVRAEYRITDTGRYVHCEEQFKNDPLYTTKKIKIWKVTITFTNNSNRNIRFPGRGVGYMKVRPNRGSPLDYCFHFPDDDSGHLPQHGDRRMHFVIPRADLNDVQSGESLSETRYWYLYEGRKPIVESWRVLEYRFLKETATQPKPSVVDKPLALDRKKKALIQRGLASLKFDPGPTDGFFGPKTRAAILAWQKAKGYGEASQTGRLTKEQADALALVGEEAQRKRTETKRKAREKAERARVARQARARAEKERKHARVTKEVKEPKESERKTATPLKAVCDHRLEGRWIGHFGKPRVQLTREISLSTNRNGSLVLRLLNRYPGVLKDRYPGRYKDLEVDTIIDGKVHKHTVNNRIFTYVAWCKSAIDIPDQKIFRRVIRAPQGKRQLVDYVVSSDGSELVVYIFGENNFTMEAWDIKNSSTSSASRTHRYTRD